MSIDWVTRRDRLGELVAHHGAPQPVRWAGFASGEVAAAGDPTQLHDACAAHDVVIPVYNEERALRGCVEVLKSYLDGQFPFEWTITIVDNASTDATLAIAGELAEATDQVRVLHLDEKGRGRALRTAWQWSDADVVAYMDVDLSTGLDALLPLVAPLVNGHSDVSIGSRLAPGARTVRGPKREFISRCYNAIIRLSHGATFSDAQCGFKAARTDVIRPLLSHIEDDNWFFDTELLLLAEHNGLRVHEVPVDWVEDIDSRVRIGSTALEDIRGLIRVARAKAVGTARVADLPRRPEPKSVHPDAVVSRRDTGLVWQLLSFGAIGVLSTVVTLGGTHAVQVDRSHPWRVRPCHGRRMGRLGDGTQ